jgi:transcriptional repressor NrdR
VASRLVGEMVMDELRALDEVAYVRFASVYRRFQDVIEFQDEIQRLRDLDETVSGKDQLSLLPYDSKKK